MILVGLVLTTTYLEVTFVHPTPFDETNHTCD